MNEKEKYFRLGMMYRCASYLNMDITSKCVLKIVDTYLQLPNKYCDFFEWMRSLSNEQIQDMCSDKNE